ncbi:hypothetical protein WG936_05540 [Corynebacterium sp. H127]|uniref:Acb2/Tad1 domain-containing protein n=1 Tax=Corynebacterium sp. H127 TaxID=3133418 RepID=UPI003097AC6D
MATPDLKTRFDFHPATTEIKRTNHATIRQACLRAAEVIDETAPDSREKALALTKLEEAMMWGNAAIARHDEEGSH